MRQKISKLAQSFQRLPLPMQLIIVASLLATVIAALSIQAYQRYAAAQRSEQQALWPHMNGGAPPNREKFQALSGVWLYETQQRRARLQMTADGVFQLITRRKDLITRRNYIRGFYTVQDQTLFLRQDDRFGKPYVEGRPEINFYPVSLSDAAFDYQLKRRGGRMLWTFTNDSRDIQNLQNSLAGASVNQVLWYKAR